MTMGKGSLLVLLFGQNRSELFQKPRLFGKPKVFQERKHVVVKKRGEGSISLRIEEHANHIFSVNLKFRR